jgi:hypothetical protein
LYFEKNNAIEDEKYDLKLRNAQQNRALFLLCRQTQGKDSGAHNADCHSSEHNQDSRRRHAG